MPLTLISLARLLKSETLDQHRSTEHLLYPKLDGILTAKDYSDILKAFYGFYSPLENSISSFIFRDHLPDIDERKNARLIIDDLISLGENVFELPVCTSLPEINSRAQALGALYVMEGSTLGGRMIRKMLLKNHPDLIRESQLSFFNGYGELTGHRWKVFQESLELEENHKTVIDSANETFSLFQKWIKAYLYDEQDRP